MCYIFEYIMCYLRFCMQSKPVPLVLHKVKKSVHFAVQHTPLVHFYGAVQ